MVVVWWLCGGCVVVVWWLCGGCVVVVWWLCGGCVVVVCYTIFSVGTLFPSLQVTLQGGLALAGSKSGHWELLVGRPGGPLYSIYNTTVPPQAPSASCGATLCRCSVCRHAL